MTLLKLQVLICCFLLGFFSIVVQAWPSKSKKHISFGATTRENTANEANATTYITLTSENFDDFLESNEMAFVDFDAPWCAWCQRLAPTWEKFAQTVKETETLLGVGKLDCMAEPNICRQQKVMAFPALRWLQSGHHVPPDCKMDRTVDVLIKCASRKLGPRKKVGVVLHPHLDEFDDDGGLKDEEGDNVQEKTAEGDDGGSTTVCEQQKGSDNAGAV